VRLTINKGTDCETDTVDSIRIPFIAQADFELAYEECDSVIQLQNNSENDTSYYWTFGDGETLSGAAEPHHLYDETGQYNVKLVVNKGAACSDSAQQALFVQRQTDAFFSLRDSSCDSLVSPVNESRYATHYRWQFEAVGEGGAKEVLLQDSTYQRPYRFPGPGQYQVRLTTNPGGACSDSFSHPFRVVPTVPAEFTYQPKARCSREVQLIALAPKAERYAWHLGGDTLGSAASPVQQYSFPADSTYQVQLITNPHTLCPDTISRKLKVGDFTEAAFALEDTACAPYLKPLNLSQNARSYAWYLDGKPAGQQRKLVLGNVQPGSHTLRLVVDDNTLCADTMRETVQVAERPASEFEISQEPCSPLLELTASNQQAAAYQWQLQPGVTQSGSTIQHAYPEGGTQSIRLVTTNFQGCTDTTMQQYPYSPEGVLNFRLPNVFTPNQDNRNESFCIIAEQRPCVQSLQIYNRWGQRVYTTDDPSQCWRGRWQGEPAPEGVYVYQLEIANGRTRTGTVTLLR
jgi:gliding motility-associated-like protein